MPLRHVAEVRTSSVDKHTHAGELPVQLCNYTDVYKNDRVGPGPDLMRATATSDEVSRFRLEVGDSILTKIRRTRQTSGFAPLSIGPPTTSCAATTWR